MLLTNDYRWDGFGAQYQNIIWSILWAECNGHTFYYSPIERMLVGGNQKPANVDKMSKLPDELLQSTLYAGTDIEDEHLFIEQALQCMNVKEKYPLVKSVPHGSVVFSLKSPFFFKDIERDMERFHETPSFRKIQDAFFENKKNPFDDNHVHVAVHIRRPVSFDIRHDGANTQDNYYERCMLAILMKYKDSPKPVLFHLFSQGKPEDFERYMRFPVQLHLEDDTFTTFEKMVFANVLITSASSFSYVAALLSKGEIVYLPFWHPPRKHWFII